MCYIFISQEKNNRFKCLFAYCYLLYVHMWILHKGEFSEAITKNMVVKITFRI